jgi:hypothetical protein
MTVRELIEKLQTMPQDVEVLIDSNAGEYVGEIIDEDWRTIEYIEDFPARYGPQYLPGPAVVIYQL